MTSPRLSRKKLNYVRVFLPTFMTISLFIIALFIIVIPQFENLIVDRKREMLRELTDTVVSMIDEWRHQELSGRVSRHQAQTAAIGQIQSLRYGAELKDYFWVTDQHPVMIVHPYRPDLNGKDLTHFQDSHGKRLFVEMVEAVKTTGGGYVDYMWQWKDDSTKIVAKLSYVKAFAPWGWVVGTGIYIEDVKDEIALLERKIITISIIISILSSLLLLYIAFQNLRSEKLRKLAEEEVKESREQYRMLVEAAGEGLIMILENRQVFFNKAFYSMLGYEQMTQEPDLADLFVGFPQSKLFDFERYQKLGDDKTAVEQIETKLKKQGGELLDVLLFISPVSLKNSNGIIISVKDARLHKAVVDAAAYSRENYLALINRLDMGVFRASADRNAYLTDANPALMRLLGLTDREELQSVSLFEFFVDEDEKEKYLQDLQQNGSIGKRMIRLRNKRGRVIMAAISAVHVKSLDEEVSAVDGMVEDLSEQHHIDRQKDALIAELQTTHLLLDQAIKPYVRELPQCGLETTVAEAVQLMSAANSSAILVKKSPDQAIGILTDSDIRGRVVAAGAGYDQPVTPFMTAPVVTIPLSATVYDALTLIHRNGLRHLVVRDVDNKTAGVLYAEHLFEASHLNGLFFIKRIETASSVKQIAEYRTGLLLLLKGLIASQVRVRAVTKIISLISDAVTRRIIEIAIKEFGPPPAKFAFLTMGSEGREEQTLSTDQDNAIVYEDVAADNEEPVSQYFIKLGARIADDLHTAGYQYCKGEVMAKNSKWCRPFSVWKQYFTDWVTNASPQDLLEVKIFFDFRIVYGEASLSAQLSEFVNKLTGRFDVFFVYLAENVLRGEIPDDMRKLKTAADIKMILLPIVDFARLYSLKHQLNITNTQDRLEALAEKQLLTKSFYRSISFSYNFLMQHRLRHQVERLLHNQPVDNTVDSENFSEFDVLALKKIFAGMDECRNKIRSEFISATSR